MHTASLRAGSNWIGLASLVHPGVVTKDEFKPWLAFEDKNWFDIFFGPESVSEDIIDFIFYKESFLLSILKMSKIGTFRWVFARAKHRYESRQ